MKRFFLLAVMALSFVGVGLKPIGPIPECDPCPWVR
jgi:hypothetical protein